MKRFAAIGLLTIWVIGGVAAFSASGVFAQANGDGCVEMREQLLFEAGSSLSFVSLAWSPDGSRLATTDDSPTVRVWDTNSGNLLTELPGRLGDAASSPWSPDGTRLAIFTRTGDVVVLECADQAVHMTDLEDAINLGWANRAPDGAFVLGNPAAPITLVVFSDFVCPHCITYESTIQEFIRQFVARGQAKLEYRMFPTAGGDLTRFAGQIAECADEAHPGLFWEVRDFLDDLARTEQYSQDLGQRIANEFALNYAELLSCSTVAQQVTTDVAFGRDQDITGTPAVRVRYGDEDAEIIVVNGMHVQSGGPSLGTLVEMMEMAGP